VKLAFCDPSFVLFASEALDEQDDDPPPPRASEPFVGLKEYVSAVHVRAAARAINVSKRGRRTA
jgi:hypothetical protein